MRDVIKVLNEAGLKESNFYVPFANGNFPTLLKDHWFELKMEQWTECEQELEEACRKYCKENGIGTIPDSLLSQCLQIPDEGMEMKNLYGLTWTFPLIQSGLFDCTCPNYLGKYNTKNGVCVFVNSDGKTYITRNWHVLSALVKAGYAKSKNFFVPLSSGEIPTDPKLLSKWLSIRT